jgi:hypothetical protein
VIVPNMPPIVTLDVGSGTRIRFVKQAVARKFVQEGLEEEASEES